MAKITLSSIFTEIYGRFGGLMFKRSRKGKTILSRIPNTTRVRWSNAQKAHRKQFALAVIYAKAAMKDPDLRARCEQQALERDSIPFNMAISDYFASHKKSYIEAFMQAWT